MNWAAAALAVAITWDDLPPKIRQWLGGDEAAFQQKLQRIETATRQRMEEGEWDHLVYYLLQGRAFTKRAPIEPALSAREFVESGETPEAVRRRVEDFLSSETSDPRMEWARKQSAGAGRERLTAEYGRAMRFLYEKEWKLRNEPGARRRELTARLYQTRGHSSDTSADSLPAMEAGIAVLKELQPDANFRNVLVVGPGADLAPRTALRESAPPRSYQPDRIRELLPSAAVECIDVNPRVVETAGCVEQVNILTSHRGRRYDLIVITNVLVYFDTRELALALANLRAMLNPGGVLLHNELRAEVEPLARALDLPVAHARTIRIGGSGERPLYDGVILHRLD
jgi:hypothetical protein